MKLVKCRNCGTVVMSQDTMLENLTEEYNEVSKKALRERNPENKKILTEHMKFLASFIKQVNHANSQIYQRSITVECEAKELKNHLVNNNIMTWEQIAEIEAEGRRKADIRSKEEADSLERKYGSYKSAGFSFNKTKKDTTAKEAMRNAKV